MKELLIFLLLIFFIESKTQISEPIPKPIGKINLKAIKKTISKQNEVSISKQIGETTKPFKSCVGGILINDFCKCPKGTKYYRGICTKQPLVKCEGGILKDNKCICLSKKRLPNGKCLEA